MCRKNVFVSSLLLGLIILVAGCGPFHSPDPNPAYLNPWPSPAKTISIDKLETIYGFNVPSPQEKGDELPPQPGTMSEGKMVKGGPNSDTNWTAFSLVLYVDEARQYKILTQKRAITPVGRLETPGGHLVGGQTWRDGARDELQQEAGIKVENNDLMFLQGGIPGIGAQDNLYGNVNFVVVFDKKPLTNNDSPEIDKTYGHQWRDLKTIFHEIAQEQQELDSKNIGFAHGKYYGFFRGHLLYFCRKVLDCRSL